MLQWLSSSRFMWFHQFLSTNFLNLGVAPSFYNSTKHGDTVHPEAMKELVEDLTQLEKPRVSGARNQWSLEADESVPVEGTRVRKWCDWNILQLFLGVLKGIRVLTHNHTTGNTWNELPGLLHDFLKFRWVTSKVQAVESNTANCVGCICCALMSIRPISSFNNISTFICA